MPTVVLEKPGRFVLENTPEPTPPGPGEVLVRIRRVGICGTDLHAFEGTQPFFDYPRILGHELGVEVIAAGREVTHIHPGDLCAVVPYMDCGDCVPCRMGKTNCCSNLDVLGVHVDGGMRDVLVLPAEKLLRSDVMSLEQLALVETLGIGAHAVDRAAIERGETVLLIGAGPIGLSVLTFALLAGARVILLEISARRIEFCKRRYDLFEVISDTADVPSKLHALLGGELPTAVFDATGHAGSMTQAHDYVSNGGRLIYVGITGSRISFDGPAFHRREMTLLGSRNARTVDLQRVIGHIEAGRIDTSPWITHRADPEGMLVDFPSWLDPESGVVKAVLEMA
ncbi:MAG: zinc-binding alcohol dehydrogenase family protein [Gemmatimonadota bacterium]|nr:zinc-binding alcohol dehydrogenase family protein [Gemmatimonadota bacterium]